MRETYQERLRKHANAKINIIIAALKEAQKRYNYATLAVMPAESGKHRSTSPLNTTCDNTMRGSSMEERKYKEGEEK